MSNKDLEEFYSIYENNNPLTKGLFKHLKLEHDDLLDIINKGEEYYDILLFTQRLPLDILDLLARKGDRRIKSLVCMKYPLLAETYEYLYQQGTNIRSSLCNNPRLPQHIINLLLNDESEFIRYHMEDVLEKNEKKLKNKPHD